MTGDRYDEGGWLIVGPGEPDRLRSKTGDEIVPGDELWDSVGWWHSVVIAIDPYPVERRTRFQDWTAMATCADGTRHALAPSQGYTVTADG